VTDTFDLLEERHGRSKPQRFQFDNTRTKYDGTKIAGEFVEEREFEYADQTIPSKILLTRDGTYRDVALWPATDKEGNLLKPREYHLPHRWAAAAPRIGDFVVIEVEFKESATTGNTYADFTVTVLRREDIDGVSEAAEVPDKDDLAGFDPASQVAKDEMGF
jgi:hypothetical protein